MIGAKLSTLLWAAASLATVSVAIDPFSHQNEDILGWKRFAAEEVESASVNSLQHGSYSETAAEAYPHIRSATYTQPLDHRRDASSNLTFEQRYWYSLKHYKPSSKRGKNKTVPLIVMEGGETDATARLAYLDHGILDILAEATGGIGIVLEHRYYGESYPTRSQFGPGKSWGVDQLRWLTNWQAEQDSVQFVRQLKLEGLQDDDDLNSQTTPVISYGGSYAGARAAHLRLLYPEDFYGAVASSAVVAAVEDFPEYMYGVARGNDVYAIQALQAAVAGIDAYIAPQPHKGWRQDKVDVDRVNALLAFTGLEGLSDTGDFANLLMEPLGGYQSVNWDDNLSPQYWAPFITAMINNPSEKELLHLRSKSSSYNLNLPDESLRYLHYLNTTFIQPCRQGKSKRSADDCFGSHNYTKFITNPKLTMSKAWMYQVCTTWGYFITSPKVGFNHHSGPKLISSLLDHEYQSKLCRHGFPPGKHNSIPKRPDVDSVNKLGNFKIEVDRLAYIDGQYDPWKEMTVHSETFNNGGIRSNTLNKPFWIIPNGTHHWDENGLPHNSNQEGSHHRIVHNRPEEDGAQVPQDIRKVHQLLVGAVKDWVQQWDQERA
ncbi:unnamed protein product [Sympodiomycopsis kandeliae]